MSSWWNPLICALSLCFRNCWDTWCFLWGHAQGKSLVGIANHSCHVCALSCVWDGSNHGTRTDRETALAWSAWDVLLFSLFLSTLKYKQDPRANFVLCILMCFDHEDIQQQFHSDWSQYERTGPLPGVCLVHNLKEVFLQRDIKANHTKASWSLCSLMTTKIIVLANSLFEPLWNSLKLFLFIIINYHCHFVSSVRFKFHIVSLMKPWWWHIHSCGFCCCLSVTFNRRPKLCNWNIKKDKPKVEGKYIWPAVKTRNFIYSLTQLSLAKLPYNAKKLTKIIK